MVYALLFFTQICLTLYSRSETCHKKRNPATWHLHVAHPLTKYQLTDYLDECMLADSTMEFYRQQDFDRLIGGFSTGLPAIAQKAPRVRHAFTEERASRRPCIEQ